MKTLKDFQDAELEFVSRDCWKGCDGDMTFFAWRENKGVMPKFKGRIDITFRDGVAQTGKLINNWYWGLSDRHADIIKWRPSLEQDDVAPVDDKPVFTQAMADAGELPPVGSEAILRYMHDSKTVTHTGYVLYASRDHCIMDVNGNPIHLLIGGYAYEPPQTERDIAIKAMGKVCSMAHGEKELFEALYDAGLRLPEGE